MSPQDLASPKQQGVPVQKPKSDVYTMMLFISFMALILAVILLCMEMSKYNWDIKAQDVQLRSSIQQTAPAQLLPVHWA